MDERGRVVGENTHLLPGTDFEEGFDTGVVQGTRQDEKERDGVGVGAFTTHCLLVVDRDDVSTGRRKRASGIGLSVLETQFHETQWAYASLRISSTRKATRSIRAASSSRATTTRFETVDEVSTALTTRVHTAREVASMRVI